MLKRLSEKIGFTQTEIKVIIFLLAAFFIGFGYKAIINSNKTSKYKLFDYSQSDSLFNASSIDTLENQKKNEINDKKVDYKQEVLDFNETNFKDDKVKKLPAERSINLNKAGKIEFTRLPGIGDKTAAKIIEYRNKTGRFSKLDDLLKVKGIGNSKFNKIKKYLYIE